MPLPWALISAMVASTVGAALLSRQKPVQPRLTEDEETMKVFRARMLGVSERRADKRLRRGAYAGVMETYGSVLNSAGPPTIDQVQPGQAPKPGTGKGIDNLDMFAEDEETRR